MATIDRRTAMAGGWAMTVLAGAGEAAAARPAPLVIGHRGASALRPEHTLASYAKAIADGADYIEPDLVVSRDGHLIVRHENNIAETTDIARHPEFAGRRTEKTIDGQRQISWFTEDFTLAELKTLRAIERLPKVRPDNAAMDGRFDIVTWPEMIDFAAAEAAARGRAIGLIPELKHSTYFAGIGLPLEARFADSVAAHAYARTCPLVVQSFEVGNLRAMKGRLANHQARLMQLVSGEAGAAPFDERAVGGALTYRAMMTPAGLAEVARYADILAPDTRSIIPMGAGDRLTQPTTLVADAHRAGLVVMPWTFRPENRFLAADFRDGAGLDARNPVGSQAEIAAYLATGIDGFFTDDPALGRAAVLKSAR